MEWIFVHEQTSEATTTIIFKVAQDSKWSFANVDWSKGQLISKIYLSWNLLKHTYLLQELNLLKIVKLCFLMFSIYELSIFFEQENYLELVIIFYAESFDVQ